MRTCPVCHKDFYAARKDNDGNKYCPECRTKIFYHKKQTLTEADYRVVMADKEAVDAIMDSWAWHKEQTTLAPYLLEGKAFAAERKIAINLLNKCKRYVGGRLDYRAFALALIDEFFTEQYSYAHDAFSMMVLMGKPFMSIAPKVYRVMMRQKTEEAANERRAKSTPRISSEGIYAVI